VGIDIHAIHSPWEQTIAIDPAVPRLFIIDGSKALAKAVGRSFGRHTPIQRCQIHKARNIMELLSPALHASVRRALCQAWELDDAAKAEKLIRNLDQRLERDAPLASQKASSRDWMKSSQ
jgi:transposase-like protein